MALRLMIIWKKTKVRWRSMKTAETPLVPVPYGDENDQCTGVSAENSSELMLPVKLKNRDSFMPERVVQLAAFQPRTALLREHGLRMGFVVFVIDARSRKSMSQ